MKTHITINQSHLPLKCVGVSSLGQAGRGVDVQVDLLGQLYHSDVIAWIAVALMVGVIGHGDINLGYSSLTRGGEVVFSKSDLITGYTLLNALPS